MVVNNTPPASDWALASKTVAAVSRQYADAVDTVGRFPSEAVATMRQQRLLGCAIEGALSLVQIAEMTSRIAAGCASAGLVFAMHQAQAVVLSRHGTNPGLKRLATEAVTGQLLLASCVSENATHGDIGRSSCFVQRAGDAFTVRKKAPLISYGEEADVILVTARRDVEAAPDDQVLVACRRSHSILTRTVEWDALGVRGTCSHGFVLSSEGHTEMIFPLAHSEIASRTEVAVSHTLWAAVWLGIAAEAVAKAIDFVAHRPLEPSSAAEVLADVRLADVRRQLASVEAHVFHGASLFERGATLTGALNANHLKMSVSEAVVEITNACMRIVGLEGYLNNSRFSMSRHVRDALSAPLVVSNDRLLLNNARLARVKVGLPK